MLTLGRSWRAKNSSKFSSKYLKDRIWKIKRYLNYILVIINQNILAVLRTFLNLQKNLWKTLHQQKQPPEVCYKKGVLKNFVNFTGKHHWQSLFLNKIAGLRPEACNLIKKEALAQVVSCEIFEIFKNTFFIQHLRTTASDTKQTSKVATTEFLSKIPNRKKISNEHFNICEVEISLDVS